MSETFFWKQIFKSVIFPIYKPLILYSIRLSPDTGQESRLTSKALLFFQVPKLNTYSRTRTLSPDLWVQIKTTLLFSSSPSLQMEQKILVKVSRLKIVFIYEGKATFTYCRCPFRSQTIGMVRRRPFITNKKSYCVSFFLHPPSKLFFFSLLRGFVWLRPHSLSWGCHALA